MTNQEQLRRHADDVWCRVYSELSDRYQMQHGHTNTGGHEDFFAEKRRAVEAQAMADTRVLEANRMADEAREAGQ